MFHIALMDTSGFSGFQKLCDTSVVLDCVVRHRVEDVFHNLSTLICSSLSETWSALGS